MAVGGGGSDSSDTSSRGRLSVSGREAEADVNGADKSIVDGATVMERKDIKITRQSMSKQENGVNVESKMHYFKLTVRNVLVINFSLAF